MAIISTSDLASYLAITDTVDNTQLANAANAANALVVRICGRSFDTTATASARSYHPFSSHLVRVDDFHTTTGLVVATDTSDNGTFDTTWVATDYQVEPLNGVEDGETVPYRRIRSLEAKTFPTGGHRPSVQVTAQWGWATVPAPVKQGALLLGARMFKRKDSPMGSVGFDEFALRLTREDPDLTNMLMAYKRFPVLI